MAQGMIPQEYRNKNLRFGRAERLWTIRVVLVVFLLLSLWVCCDSLEKVSLTSQEKTHALELARAYLAGNPAPENDIRTYRHLYHGKTLGAFLTLARQDKPALTAFAQGASLRDTLHLAADDLQKRIPAGEVDAGRLRIDVIERIVDRGTWRMGQKWKLDPSREGLLLETEPRVALLGQELKDWGVIAAKGKYRHRRMMALLHHRGLADQDTGPIRKNQDLPYATFTAISFMETEKDGIVDLRRGNPVGDFAPTAANLRRAIEAAGDYLKHAVREDGSFEYLYHPETNHWPDDYNELRHAGTAFAMMQIYDLTRDPELLAATRRALDWLKRHTRGPDRRDSQTYDWQALNNEKFQYAKLGGSGLSLLAFGWYTKVTGDRQYLEMMQGYGRFIEYMMAENGDVRMRYYYAPEDKDKEVQPVLYYPGEAFFGLTTLHELDGDPRWIATASKGIDFIVDQRDAEKPDDDLPHDHWMAYAINGVYRVHPKESHAQHAWRLFRAMNAQFHDTHRDPDLVGGYYRSPGSVQTACRMEAMGALYRLAEQRGEEKRMARFFEVLSKGASFLMRTQYNDVNTMFFADPGKPRGGFMLNYTSPEIQIDFVQHSVSALILTYRILLEREAAGLAE